MPARAKLSVSDTSVFFLHFLTLSLVLLSARRGRYAIMAAFKLEKELLMTLSLREFVRALRLSPDPPAIDADRWEALRQDMRVMNDYVSTLLSQTEDALRGTIPWEQECRLRGKRYASQWLQLELRATINLHMLPGAWLIRRLHYHLSEMGEPLRASTTQTGIEIFHAEKNSIFAEILQELLELLSRYGYGEELGHLHAFDAEDTAPYDILPSLQRSPLEESIAKYRGTSALSRRPFRDSTIQSMVLSLSMALKHAVVAGAHGKAADIVAILEHCEPLEELVANAPQALLLHIVCLYYWYRDTRGALQEAEVALTLHPQELWLRRAHDRLLDVVQQDQLAAKKQGKLGNARRPQVPPPVEESVPAAREGMPLPSSEMKRRNTFYRDSVRAELRRIRDSLQTLWDLREGEWGDRNREYAVWGWGLCQTHGETYSGEDVELIDIGPYPLADAFARALHLAVPAQPHFALPRGAAAFIPVPGEANELLFSWSAISEREIARMASQVDEQGIHALRNFLHSGFAHGDETGWGPQQIVRTLDKLFLAQSHLCTP